MGASLSADVPLADIIERVFCAVKGGSDFVIARLGVLRCDSCEMAVAMMNVAIFTQIRFPTRSRSSA